MASSKVIPVDAENFAQVVLQDSHNKLVLVDFWAPWCGPCQNVAPLLDQLSLEYAEQLTITKLNTDQFPTLAQQYAVRSLPTLKLFRDAAVLDEMLGAQPKQALLEWLRPHLHFAWQDELARISDFYQAGERNAAAEHLHETLNSVSASDEGGLQYALWACKLREFETAQQIYQNLDRAVQGSAPARAVIAWLKLHAASQQDNAIGEVVQQALQGDVDDAVESLLAQFANTQPATAADPIRQILIQLFETMDDINQVRSYRARLARLLH